MEYVAGILKNTVPISLFNRGMAGKLFKMVRETGPKVVMKNNLPECVLVSPEEYIKMVDEIEDMKLQLLAEERIKNGLGENWLSTEDMIKKYDIDKDELDRMPEVEFE